MSSESLRTTCCIVGGGPSGIMLGYLLARGGVQVTVLEKHGDFFRDFRGDTVHPSTLEVLDELGLLDDFLKIPHQEVTSVGGIFGDLTFRGPDFRHVPGRCKFAALMPQWDFLNFLSERARAFPHFDLRMQHEALELTRDDDCIITGVLARGPNGTPVSIRADLVVGCDGRNSTMRKAAQLELVEFGVPIDVLWFRIGRQPNDPEQVLGVVNFGKALILINRDAYFQAGLIIRKGSFGDIEQAGIEAFRHGLLELCPWLDGRVNELREWDQVKLLTVQINRLRQWYRPGLLCIGDSAHAMSPAGGVGINLAIQDAVAAANLLMDGLREGRVTEAMLAAVQKRREFPARATQAVQVKLHNAFDRVFASTGPLQAPWGLKAALQIPGIHRALGYVVGVGVRPEHVQTTKQPSAHRRSRAAIAIGAAIGAAAGFIAVMAWRRKLAARRLS
ncbi:MAG TPA: FAD-dependent oxidoreductase [Bryobacteraceae bacterium]|nr:FAD-dependent oxidoreductase [Bryobacteraceae bacterium]